MQKNSRYFYSACLWASIALSVSGCATVANLTGNTSKKMNSAAAQHYRRTVQLAEARHVLDTSSVNAQRVQAIFQRLIPPANRANQTGERLVWEVALLRSKTINAWSMPGGKVIIYSGLLDSLNLTDDEIAAILGHEMAHVLHEDGKKTAGRKTLTRVASTTVGIAVQIATAGMAGSFAQLGADVLGHYGFAMPHSRSQENRADEMGMRLMAEAGYDPASAIQLWRKMDTVRNNNTLATAFTSSHPTNQDRMDNLRRLLPQMQAIYQRHRSQYEATETVVYPLNKPVPYTVQRLNHP